MLFFESHRHFVNHQCAANGTLERVAAPAGGEDDGHAVAQRGQHVGVGAVALEGGLEAGPLVGGKQRGYLHFLDDVGAGEHVVAVEREGFAFGVLVAEEDGIDVRFVGAALHGIHLCVGEDLARLVFVVAAQGQGLLVDGGAEDRAMQGVEEYLANVEGADEKVAVGEEKSIIDGVINMNSLFNRVYKRMKENGKDHQYPPLTRHRLSADAILSTLTNGERRPCTAKRSYSIDGIENVMDFLDKLENDEVEGVEFLELRACDQSCAGALLTVDNRFLCGERMYARARRAAERERNGEMPRDREMDQYRDFLIKNSLVDEVQPRSMLVLDEDRVKAFEKMERIEKMKECLPQIDCGVCGAPTCEAFATDVVCDECDLHRCVFYRLHLESQGKMSLNEGRSNMYSVWGDDRISGEIEV